MNFEITRLATSFKSLKFFGFFFSSFKLFVDVVFCVLVPIGSQQNIDLFRLVSCF